jgi:phosphatidylethanolamine-binding protein (PEBP) family uncharacterized protein
MIIESYRRANRGFWAGAIVLALAAAGCSSSSPSASADSSTSAPNVAVFGLTSEAFEDGGVIPAKYACSAKDPVSIPVAWQGAPAGTVAFVLAMEDLTNSLPHWVVVNLPGSPEGSLPEGFTRSSHSVQVTPYLPPCPNPGNTSFYRITLYALSASVDVAALTYGPEMMLIGVRDAIDGKVLAEASIQGSWANR